MPVATVAVVEVEEEDSITKGEVEVNRATDNREVMEATAEVSSNLITVYLRSHMLKEGNGRKVYTFEDAGNHISILKPKQDMYRS